MSFPLGARVTRRLHSDLAGGLLLVLATVAAMISANVAGGGWYAAFRDVTIGPTALHLHLSIGDWTADGLLAVFFFTVGLELKQEFVTGDLRNPRHALIPMAAAAGGVAVPALLFTVITVVSDSPGVRGWAVPTATDIAFAVSVLAIAGRHAPSALRTFLLTLAVVDDLIAIIIIALVYPDHISFSYLLAALACISLFAAVAHRRRCSPWLLLPLAIVAWVLMHASGIHATIAGVLLGLVVPVRLAPRLENAWRPASNAIAVPLFAFFAAGVTVGGITGFGRALSHPVTLAVMIALVVGKPLGVLTGAWIAVSASGTRLHSDLCWRDVGVVGVLAGIGFTVSLLVGDLAYGTGIRNNYVKVGVLCASFIAASSGALLLQRSRPRRDHISREQRDATERAQVM
jgi:NhaA family Na+:H+ antiporter